MRIKNLPPHSKQTYTLNYLFQKSQTNDMCELVYFNDNNNSLDAWIGITTENCQKREGEKGFKLDWNKNTMHFVLSVHPDDAENISHKWKEILFQTHKHFNIDPYENNSIAWLHKDKDHHHIHLVFSKIDAQANRWDDSNIGYRLNEFAKSLDKQYDLTATINDDPAVNKNEPIKADLNKRLGEMYSNSYDFDDFLSQAAAYNVSITTSKKDGKEPYLIFTDLVTGFEFPSTSFSKRYSFNSLTKLDKSNPKKEYVSHSDQKAYLSTSIKKALFNSKSVQDLKFNIEKYQIKLIEHSNTSGVFGYSFIQEGVQNPITFKGSEVGYTYKKINYLLELNSQKEINISRVDGQLDDKSPAVHRNNYFPGMPGSQSEDHEEELRKKKRKKRRRNI